METNWKQISSDEEIGQNEKRVAVISVMIVKSDSGGLLGPLAQSSEPLARRTDVMFYKGSHEFTRRAGADLGVVCYPLGPARWLHTPISRTMSHGRCHLFFLLGGMEVINFSGQFVELAFEAKTGSFTLRQYDTGESVGGYRKIIPFCKQFHECLDRNPPSSSRPATEMYYHRLVLPLHEVVTL